MGRIPKIDIYFKDFGPVPLCQKSANENIEYCVFFLRDQLNLTTVPKIEIEILILIPFVGLIQRSHVVDTYTYLQLIL